MEILVPNNIKKTQEEIFNERRRQLESVTHEAKKIAKLKRELFDTPESAHESEPEERLYVKDLPPQKQIRNRETLNSIAVANNAAGRVVVRKTKSEFDAHAMLNDWDVAAYDRHNRCPVCGGIPLTDTESYTGRGRKSSASKQSNSYTLILTRKLANEQDFVCRNCKKKFKLIKDVRIEGKFGTHWRNELEEI